MDRRLPPHARMPRLRHSSPHQVHALAAGACMRGHNVSHRRVCDRRRLPFVNATSIQAETAHLFSASLRLERSAMAIVSRDSRTVALEILERPGPVAKIVSVQSGAATELSRVRATISSRGVQAIGIAIGTATPTICGMGTVAVGSTIVGSSSISDSFRGTAIPTITTPTITTIRIRTAMTPAFTTRASTRITTTRALTILPIKARTQLLLPLKTDWADQVITTDKST